MIRFKIRKLFYRVCLVCLSACIALGQLPLRADLGLPQSLDAAWVLRDVHAVGPLYTDLLRRFIPGQALEESLLSYLLDLGYPDFEDLSPQSPIGLFLGKKEPHRASRLAFIALKLKETSSLRDTLAQQGWTVYHRQGWSFISLAAADSFSQNEDKDAWLSYLNAPQTEDISCLFSCEGLEGEMQALYHFLLQSFAPSVIQDTAILYENRPLALVLKQEIRSLETIRLCLNYVTSEDRLDITSTLKARPGTALAEFFAKAQAKELSFLDLEDPPRAFFKANLAIQPQSLVTYLNYLQSKALALDSLSLASSGQGFGAKGSSWLTLGLQSLASFERAWNGQSLLYCFYPHNNDLGLGFSVLDFTLFQGGAFTQAEVYAIAQGQVSYLPAFWQSLSPDQDQIIHANLTPSALKVGDCFFHALTFQAQAKGDNKASRDCTLYSGSTENYGIFTTHTDGLAAMVESLDFPASPQVTEATQPCLIRADCNLLAWYKRGPSLEALRLAPKTFVTKGEASLDTEGLKIAIHLPLRALELIFLSPHKEQPLDLGAPSIALSQPSEKLLTEAQEESD